MVMKMNGFTQDEYVKKEDVLSVRAIVGYKRTDGTIIGAWVWNAEYAIKNDLKRDFKSLLDVNFILEVGMFNTIYFQKEYKDFVNQARARNIDISDKVFTKYGNSVISQDSHHIGRKSVEYRDIKDVLAQDINVAYIYENSEWKEYRQRHK